MRRFCMAAALLACVVTRTWATPQCWYLNDTSTVGDVFTTETGASANDGLTPGTPKLHLGDLNGLLGPGDSVMVDAGTYPETAAFTITTELVTIMGKDSSSTVVNFQDSSFAAGRYLRAENASGVIIRDLGIISGYHGVWFYNVDNGLIERVNVAGSGNLGIFLFNGAEQNVIRNCVSNSNVGHGILLQTASNDNLVEGNRCSYNNQFGISMNVNEHGNIFRSNVAESNGLSGVDMSNGVSGNAFLENATRFNEGNGIYGGYDDQNDYTGNLADGNAVAGIDLSSSWDNIVRQNEITGTSGIGVYLTEDAPGNIVEKNNITGSNVYYEGGPAVSVARNWWGTVESAAIRSAMTGSGEASLAYTPFRLGAVDTAAGADTIAPSAPDTVGAKVENSAVRVTWQASAGSEEPEGAAGVAGYRIYRRIPSGTTLSRMGEVGPTLVGFLDTSVVVGETYIYRVTVMDAHTPNPNESFYSDSEAEVFVIAVVVSETRYDYDSAGQMVSMLRGVDTTTYTYDARGQMSGINTPATQIAYDAERYGLRIAQVQGATDTEYYLLDGNEVLADLRSDFTVKRRYVNGAGIDEHLGVAEFDTANALTAKRYFATDALGSVIAMTSDTGGIQQRYHYYAFGEPYEAEDMLTRYRYTGREWNGGDIGLYYYRARWMDPGVGRFTRRDPLGFEEDGPNLYEYARNNPVRYTDPFGLATNPVHEFKLTVLGWTGSLPSGGGSLNLRVKFTLELKCGFDKSDIRIDQDMKGEIIRGGSSGSITSYLNWTEDPPGIGGDWWNGSSWNGGGGSINPAPTWSGSTATFYDAPGPINMSPSQFPIYWGSDGGYSLQNPSGPYGYFLFRTNVKSPSGILWSHREWGIRIKYLAPNNGAHSYWL